MATKTLSSFNNCEFDATCYFNKILLFDTRYFGAAKDLPGVRELFEQERKC